MTLRFLLTTLVFGMFGQVYACKCVGTGTIKESVKRADVVFHGLVISIDFVSFAETLREDRRDQIRQRLRKEKGNTESFDHRGIIRIQLKLIDNFKGEVTADTLTIYSTNGGPICGFDFELAKEYIVYGTTKGMAHSSYLNEYERDESLENKNSFWTNRCTRTTLYNSQEAGDLIRLRKAGD